MTESLPNLADPATLEGARERIGRLEPGTVPRWGRMTAAQMMAHCAEVLEVTCGRPLVGTPWFVRLLAPFVKRMVLGARPYPQGTRTHPQYLQTEDRDFAAERTRLLAALDAFGSACADGANLTHPLFGRLTIEEAGRAMGKHLDHHLGQFGV